ncbi:MAG: signal peptidase II [Elusimicrobiota bacterium]|jgi:hypothetical protein
MSRRVLRVALAALVLAYAPGPQALGAFAQAVHTAPVAANSGIVSIIPILQTARPLVGGTAAPVLPALTLPTAGLQVLPGVRAAVPAAKNAAAIVRAFVPSSSANAAAVKNGDPTHPQPSLVPNIRTSSVRDVPKLRRAVVWDEREGERSAGLAAMAVLETGTRELAAAKTSTARSSTLSALFEGMRRGAAEVEPVAGAESKGIPALAPASSLSRLREREGERGSGRVQADAAAPSSKLGATLKAAAKWALPIIALTAVVYSLDFATKALAVKYLFSVFHECAWRAPLMMGIIPYITGLAFYARGTLGASREVWRWSAKRVKEGRLGFYKERISGLDEMAAEHPSLKGTVRLYDIAIALMLAGLFGNGLDAIRLGGALDWIPLGRSIINLADVALLCGLAFFQMASAFFAKARAAHAKKEPLQFDGSMFLGLPILGFFLSWALGSAPTDEVLNLALSHLGWVYVMGFSMLLGISRFLAALVLGPRVRRYRAESGVPR